MSGDSTKGTPPLLTEVKIPVAHATADKVWLYLKPKAKTKGDKAFFVWPTKYDALQKITDKYDPANPDDIDGPVIGTIDSDKVKSSKDLTTIPVSYEPYKIPKVVLAKAGGASASAMVPVFKVSATYVWCFVSNPHGMPVLIKLTHSGVKKYAKKLVAPEGAFQYVGKIDPYSFKSESDLYPLDWTPNQTSGVPIPTQQKYASMIKGGALGLGASQAAAWSTPKAQILQPPEGWDAGPDTDVNGFPEVDHAASGTSASLLPSGQVAQWDVLHSIYTPLKLTNKGKSVVVDSSASKIDLATAKAGLKTPAAPVPAYVPPELAKPTASPSALEIAKDIKLKLHAAIHLVTSGGGVVTVPGKENTYKGDWVKATDGDLVPVEIKSHVIDTPASWSKSLIVWDPAAKKVVWDSDGGWSLYGLSGMDTSDTAPAAAVADVEPEDLPAEPKVAAAPKVKLSVAAGVPKLKTLKLVPGAGAALGGAGKKDVYKDANDALYIWKPAISKSGGADQPFRALAQQGFSEIARLVKPNHIPIGIDKDKAGGLGTLQGVVELGSPPTLSGVAPASLTDVEKVDVASEHMLDWLMSQHDSHAGNLVRTKDGHVLSVDKEQGFKYFADDVLSVDYHPNEKYGESEPFYNKFWKDWAAGKFEFDPMSLSATMTKISDIPAQTLWDVADAYAEGVNPGAEKTYERYAFTKKFVSRRATMRADYEEFVTGLYKKKTGKDGKFTFASGWVGTGAAEAEPKSTFVDVTDTGRNLAIKQLGQNSIKAHKDDPDLTVIRVASSEPIEKVLTFLASINVAVAGGPKMGSNYNMVFVKTADLDGAKITTKLEIKPVPKEVAGIKPYSGKPTYFPSALVPAEQVPNVAELNTVETAKSGPLGKTFMLGGAAVEGQTASVQRVIFANGKPGFIVHFKLRKPAWEKIKGGEEKNYEWNSGKYDAAVDAVRLTNTGSHSTPAKSWSEGGNSIYLMTSSSKWWCMGDVYAEIRGDELGSVKNAVTLLLDKLGIEKDVLKDPSKADEQLYHLAQVLWSAAPKVHDETVATGTGFTIPGLTAKVLKAGITEDQIASIRQVDGPLSRGSLILPGQAKRLGKGKLLFPYWMVSTPAKVVIILRSGGACVKDRLRMGLGASGESVPTDMHTGGSDGITTRLATKSTEGLPAGSVSGPYKLILAPEVLDRLDVSYADGDSFGCVNPHDSQYGHYFTNRKSLSASVEKHTSGGSPELIIRRGIPASMIKRIVCDSESLRKSLLEVLLTAGITEHLKCPIEDFVVVDTDATTVHEKYLKPLGY